MQKRTKRFLGACGLVGVLAMIAVACALPTPDAMAKESNTTITVTVNDGSPAPYVHFVSPADGSIINQKLLKVKATASNVASVGYSLSCTKANGEQFQETIKTLPGDQAQEFEYDISGLSTSQADCTLRADATASDGKVANDVTTFKYRSLYVEIKDETAENGDPIADVRMSDDVYLLMLQVYDKQGNPVFVTKDGKEEPLMIGRDQFNMDTLQLDVVLPMEKYGALAGEYDLVVVAYGQDGKTVVSMNTNRFTYDPGKAPVNPEDPDGDGSGTTVPDVPGTGSIFGDLNISRVDYILTGLIAFGIMVAFAIYLAFRKNRR